MHVEGEHAPNTSTVCYSVDKATWRKETSDLCKSNHSAWNVLPCHLISTFVAPMRQLRSLGIRGNKTMNNPHICADWSYSSTAANINKFYYTYLTDLKLRFLLIIVVSLAEICMQEFPLSQTFLLFRLTLYLLDLALRSIKSWHLYRSVTYFK